jgi:hypothetical protein
VLRTREDAGDQLGRRHALRCHRTSQAIEYSIV